MAYREITRRKIPVKQRVVVETLRAQITSGDIPPGARLPTRGELQEQFVASTHTVQRAMDRLLRDGFIESKGTLGTFVSNSPPHLCHYGLVFPHRPAPDTLWSRFYVALQQVASGLHRSGKLDISFYYGDDLRRDTKDYETLNREVKSQRLAGLIFAHQPFEFLGTPAMDPKNGIPKVAIMPPTKESEYAAVPTVYPDHRSFYDRSLDYVKSKGRRRIGILGMTTKIDELEYLAAGLKKRGLITHPYWNLTFHPDLASAAQNATHLLMRWPRNETPDALIVSDDNLVEPVVGGLIDCGIKVPDDVELITYCNFPAAAPAVLPVKRIGCDCAQLMQRCMEIIDMQRRGQRPPQGTLIAEKFEEELHISGKSIFAA